MEEERQEFIEGQEGTDAEDPGQALEEQSFSNGYTGEYGNSVEGSGSSLYSYSYRENPQDATRSGDYYAQAVTEGQEQERVEPISIDNVPKETFYSSAEEDQGKEKKKTGLTWKKIGICAACAVLFGVLAAVCFQGMSLVFQRALGISTGGTRNIGYTTDHVDYVQAATSSAVGTADVSAIVDNTMPSVVAITSKAQGEGYYSIFGQYFEGEDTASSGSGFIVGKNDTELLIATNHHVIQGADNISVQFIDEEVYDATEKGSDSTADLAVVAVKLADIKDSTLDRIRIAHLGDSSEVKVGEMAIAIGNALGYGQSVTVGYISAKNREITETSQTDGSDNTLKVIQTDAAINPGNSGGALLNMQGEVIGINSAKIASSKVEGVGYAIPISEATPIIDELMNKEVLTENEKGYLGVSIKTVSQEASSFNMPSGVYVFEVAEGGAAQKGGILTGDIITAVNDMKVSNSESLQEKVNSYRKGTTVTITVMRLTEGSYQEKKLEVVLQGKESLDNLPESTDSGQQQESPTQQPGEEGGEYGGDSGFGGFGNFLPFGF